MSTIEKCNNFTLKKIRKKLGLSQAKFAERLGVRREVVSHWERGAHEPRLSISQIKVFAEILSEAGISLDELPDDLSSGHLSN